MGRNEEMEAEGEREEREREGERGGEERGHPTVDQLRTGWRRIWTHQVAGDL